MISSRIYSGKTGTSVMLTLPNGFGLEVHLDASGVYRIEATEETGSGSSRLVHTAGTDPLILPQRGNLSQVIRKHKRSAR